ncbi:16S rRNA (cytosine967-C5)-methyltransferase [Tistlia consotensis]|uniref:16S rRNA (Cytosine967-C5)-methyltransferase n=1 Tax=Tistlia consotensis USBA 355 TaxID=560819 RepID=A0A1Y6CMP6_9PROT|nr:transcription antitermination factor NusB [Tistlia consotensis]SMF74846.1 16S rRNA (cytosine967-C5)-methyltransferase [Tistlia consotensis USBA 355]SNS11212.1 16S rRNA (cytosine967-C5)-methyltransferase [Tistlia consotensis]
MPGAPTDPRRLALGLLANVLQRGQPFDEALAGSRGVAGLEARDRGFLRLLLATTLRRLGQIDAAVDSLVQRPLPRHPAELRDLLRLGAAQLLFLGTPPHAAVSTSLALAETRKLRGFKGLINALLRRLAREGEAILASQDAERLNLPPWLWDRLVAAYGEAPTRASVAVQLGEPPLDLSLKAGGEAAAWAERLEAEILPTGSLRRPAAGGDVTALPGFAEGAWWVQDAAAALPARLLGPVAGQRVADLCAAPGGKTAQLAAAGAEVIAVEVSRARLARIAENLKRLGLAAALVEADATAWQPPEPLPFVLLDAPCSATGTLRRHPDVARLKSPKDLPALTALQDRLLERAAAALAPGGTLVYATCSLLPEEGPERIARLLGEGAPLARRPVAPEEVGGLGELITAEGDLRTLPCHLAARGGLDGFYACRLTKSG